MPPVALGGSGHNEEASRLKVQAKLLALLLMLKYETTFGAQADRCDNRVLS